MASQVSTKFGSRAVLLSLAMAANTSLLVWQPAVSAEEKAAAPSPYEKYSAQAQTYFDGGKFLTAEKSFRRALAAAQKAGDDAKTSDALVAIGKCLVKEEKFPLAADMFKQAITLDKEKNIDASAANAQMNELASVYKNIDWTGARQEISRLITDAGVDNAYGTRSTDGTYKMKEGAVEKDCAQSYVWILPVALDGPVYKEEDRLVVKFTEDDVQNVRKTSRSYQIIPKAAVGTGSGPPPASTSTPAATPPATPPASTPSPSGETPATNAPEGPGGTNP